MFYFPNQVDFLADCLNVFKAFKVCKYENNRLSLNFIFLYIFIKIFWITTLHMYQMFYFFIIFL